MPAPISRRVGSCAESLRGASIHAGGPGRLNRHHRRARTFYSAMKPSRALVIAAGLCALGAATPCTPAEAASRCAVRGHVVPGVRHSRVTQTRGSLVVYRTRSAHSDTFWACRRGRTRRVLVGHDDSFQTRGDEYGATTTLSGFQLAGDWLLVVGETGADQTLQCSKYAQFPCPSPVDTLIAVNVAVGRHGQLASLMTGSTDASHNSTQTEWKRTLLSTAGGVAWLQTSTTYTAGSSQGTAGPSSLYGCVAQRRGGGIGCAPRLVSQGNIDPSSLGLTGTTLSWTVGGQMQSTSL